MRSLCKPSTSFTSCSSHKEDSSIVSTNCYQSVRRSVIEASSSLPVLRLDLVRSLNNFDGWNNDGKYAEEVSFKRHQSLH